MILITLLAVSLLSLSKANPCSEDSRNTILRFIELVRLVENNNRVTTMTIIDVSNYIRVQAYGSNLDLSLQGVYWDYVLKYFPAFEDEHLIPASDKEIIVTMTAHGDRNQTETGIVLTPSGDTIATGHVITGICAGLRRDRSLSAAGILQGTDFRLDNLYFATLSGDLGQSTIRFHSNTAPELIGPAGVWNSLLCPKTYTLSSTSVSECTDAELVGDIDGIIIGTVIPHFREKLKLSEILSAYYGQGLTSQIRSTNRWFLYKNLVSESYLTKQVISFAQAYRGRGTVPKEDIAALSLQTVDAFYNYPIVADNLCDKYSIRNVLKVCSYLESIVVPEFDLANSLRALFSAIEKNSLDNDFYSDLDLYDVTKSKELLKKDTGDILLVKDMIEQFMRHKIIRKTQDEQGVFYDKWKSTVSLQHVIIGLLSGLSRDNSYKSQNLDSLAAASLAGILGKAALDHRVSPNSIFFNYLGKWGPTNSCKRRYRLSLRASNSLLTQAQLNGAVDGYILGDTIMKRLKTSPNIKLTSVLEEYYSPRGNEPISALNRKTILLDKLNRTALKDQVRRFCVFYRQEHWWRYRRVSETECPTLSTQVISQFMQQETRHVSQYLPKFSVLKSLYPGYSNYGGKYSDSDIRTMASAPSSVTTNALRMSMLLNKLEGHALRKSDATNIIMDNKNNWLITSSSEMINLVQSRYGEPQLQTRDKSKLTNKNGIIYFDNGYIALWDKTRVYQANDYVANSQFTGQIKLWTTEGCQGFTNNNAQCEYYSCIDETFPCGPNGYALGYGLRYCNRFSQFYNEFTDEGKMWIDNVRACLQRALTPYYRNPQKNCDSIKEFAFSSHPRCYVDSEPGFCKIVFNNKLALNKVFQYKDFIGQDSSSAWAQLWQTMQYCFCLLKAQAPPPYQNSIGDHLNTLFVSNQQSTLNSLVPTSEVCTQWMNGGDCRFYECFEERFGCGEHTTHNYISHFELPHCLKIDQQTTILDNQGKQWVQQYKVCMMSKLGQFYNSGSVVCDRIGSTLQSSRAPCMVSAGLDRALSTNELFFNQIISTDGYPTIQPLESVYLTKQRGAFFLDNHYYRYMNLMRIQLSDAICQTKRNNEPNKNLYDVRYSKKYGLNIKTPRT